jgi:hypothetical protein
MRNLVGADTVEYRRMHWFYGMNQFWWHIVRKNMEIS